MVEVEWCLTTGVATSLLVQWVSVAKRSKGLSLMYMYMKILGVVVDPNNTVV